MGADIDRDFRPEIARVLIMDVVGYSRLLIEDQREVLLKFNAIV